MRYKVSFYFLFISFFFFVFDICFLFSSFVYLSYNMSAKLRLSLFYVFKHVRLLELLFSLCCFLVVSGLGFGHVCIHMHSVCARILEVCICIKLGRTCRPYIYARILMPRNPNLILSALISLFSYVICFYLVQFHICKFLFLYLFVCLFFTC